MTPFRQIRSPASSEWWNDYVGLPFKWNGTDRQGVSCWGLVCLVYLEVFNIRLPRFDELEAGIALGDENVADFARTGRQIALDDALPGDVLHMWGVHEGKRRPTHCGIVTQPGFVLHAESVVGSCISRYKGDNRFLHRVIGAYRLE